MIFSENRRPLFRIMPSKADIARPAAENAGLIWHPDVKTMYPTALPPGNPADR
jgi:hypothetical protein